MDAELSHGPDTGRVSAQGVPQANRKATAETSGQKLEIPPLEKAIQEAGLEEVE